MRNPGHSFTKRHQGGAALIVSLTLLLVVTVTALAAASGSTLQLGMAGATKNRNLAFQAAESALQSDSDVRAHIEQVAPLEAAGDARLIVEAHAAVERTERVMEVLARALLVPCVAGRVEQQCECVARARQHEGGRHLCRHWMLLRSERVARPQRFARRAGSCREQDIWARGRPQPVREAKDEDGGEKT